VSQAFQQAHVAGPVPPEVSSELVGSEHLIWAGQPVRGLRLRRSDLYAIPVSLLLGAFAYTWEAGVLAARSPLLFLLAGLPLVLIAIYAVIGRFFHDAWRRARTFYALTSERVIIVQRGFGRTVTSLRLKTIPDISLQEAGSGIGTVSFGGGTTSGTLFVGLEGWPGAERHLGHRFDLLANARSVYESIQAAQRVAP
jgi:hypothetical protein